MEEDALLQLEVPVCGQKAARMIGDPREKFYVGSHVELAAIIAAVCQRCQVVDGLPRVDKTDAPYYVMPRPLRHSSFAAMGAEVDTSPDASHVAESDYYRRAMISLFGMRFRVWSKDGP